MLTSWVEALAITTKTILAVAWLVIAGCSLDSTLKHRCEVASDCTGGRLCVRNTCQQPSSSDGPRANFMFVTSQKFPTRFQPIETADTKCNDAAGLAGLPGVYHAWLSTAVVYARDRVNGARGWIRTDGSPFADTVDDLANGRILTPPSLDERGHQVSGGDEDLVATGTTAFGYNDPGNTCNEWANDIMAGVLGGITGGTKEVWTSFTTVSCGPPMRIYCFGVDQNVALAPVSPSDRIAFVSDGRFFPDGGFAKADALCAQEATDAGLPGTFLALLATTNFVAASRFADLESPVWVRLDGVPINAAGSDLLAGPLLAPLNLTSKGQYLGPSFAALTGADSPLSFPTAEMTCDNWTNPTGGAFAGAIPRADTWFAGNGSTCDSLSNRVYCLQH